ncbi:hypothetical protein [Streptomyces sp. S.PB5]|uniref:hypothetical protein n=1 Tax=Streptomyces sp. S.PB5 TaxID=3020844 RepID=UPI0025AF6B97|nr:hypothetical protein [Streptomyces sp. S.PB5]MDN3023288.1 hypothetical protein [Streptomyces sp. S.PB5]
MKLRHVRAVAVVVGVVVALTGARHSSGGGCFGGSSNSGSSSSSSTGGSGSHDSDTDSDTDIDAGSVSGGGESSSLGEATQDLTIEECKVEGGTLVADVRATNSSTTASGYMFQVAFKDASGTTAATGSSGIFSVAPGGTGTATVTASATVTDGTCELVDPQRIAD